MLKNSLVRRAGKTAKYWALGTADVDLKASHNAIHFSFQISSKGGGDTQIQLEIGAQDFATLLSKMVAVNRQFVLGRMCAELNSAIELEPDRERESEEHGRGMALIRLETLAREQLHKSKIGYQTYNELSKLTKLARKASRRRRRR